MAPRKSNEPPAKKAKPPPPPVEEAESSGDESASVVHSSLDRSTRQSSEASERGESPAPPRAQPKKQATTGKQAAAEKTTKKKATTTKTTTTTTSRASTSKSKSGSKAVNKKTTKKKTRRKPITQSTHAELIFPVGRICTLLKKEHANKRVSPTAAVFMAAILEYLVADTLDAAQTTAVSGGSSGGGSGGSKLSGANLQMEAKRKRINPRHLLLSMKTDDEMASLIKDAIYAEAGVVPSLRPELVVGFARASQYAQSMPPPPNSTQPIALTSSPPSQRASKAKTQKPKAAKKRPAEIVELSDDGDNDVYSRDTSARSRAPHARMAASADADSSDDEVRQTRAPKTKRKNQVAKKTK